MSAPCGGWYDPVIVRIAHGRPCTTASTSSPISSSAATRPRAIDELVEGLERGDKHQVLLGVTGSGKTFTMAQTIARVNRPTLVMVAQQDAGGAALPGVPALLPGQRRRVLRQLLRLLPARSLRSGDRLVHREGSDDQRRDRPHAAVGDAVALRAPRRHHRRQRVVHLRPRLAGGVLRACCCRSSAASASTATQILRKLVEIQYERNDHDFGRGTFRVRGDIVEVYPVVRRERRCASSCSATRSTSSTSFDPLTGKTLRRHDKIAVYPKSHFVAPRDRTKQAVETIKEELRRSARQARVARASCSRRSGCTSGRCSTSR